MDKTMRVFMGIASMALLWLIQRQIEPVQDDTFIGRQIMKDLAGIYKSLLNEQTEELKAAAATENVK